MPDTAKNALIAATSKKFEKLKDLLTRVNAKTAMAKDSDGISIKDVIGNRAHWIGLFLGWQEDIDAGRPVSYPADGYKGKALERYNAEVHSSQADLGWDEAQAMLHQRHEQLMKVLSEITYLDLYAAPMLPEVNDWPPGHWADEVGPSHYDSAAKYIRSRIE